MRYFLGPDDYKSYKNLYKAIEEYMNSMVIAHEADPVWRQAVLSNTPSLLALRYHLLCSRLRYIFCQVLVN